MQETVQETTTFRETAKAVSHGVLAELAPPEEVEVSIFYLDPLVEMADRGEVQPVDVSDHSGGFGSTDLLAVSVVPAVVQVLKAFANGGTRAGIEETVRATRPERDRMLARIGSSRAEELREALEAALVRVLRDRLEPRTAG